MLSNKKGQMTNGIYGFLSTLQKLLSEVNPDAVAVAFDLREPTFRHKMYSGYKATRKGMPEELASQMPILKELLSAMGYNLVTYGGYEADDILGTFAKYCEDKGYECVLATGDRDSLQLVSKNVTVRIATTKFGKAESTFYDEEKIKEVYGMEPKALIDVKALQGDSSDNIPGVKGIGEKTAKELIQKFGSIDSIYEKIDSLNIKETVKNKLKNDKEMAYLSYKLGKIHKDVPIKIEDKDFMPSKADNFRVKQILTDLEFFSFMEKMNFKTNVENSEKVKVCKAYINFEKALKDNLKEIFLLAGIDQNSIKNIYVFLNGIIYVINEKNSNFKNYFSQICENKTVNKIAYDLKGFYKNFNSLSLNAPVFDVLLAAYLLSPDSKDYSIEKLAQEYGIPKADLYSEDDFIFDKGKAEEVFLISKLWKIFYKKIKENGQEDLLFNIEQPLSKVLTDMETVGFEIDKEGLESYGEEISLQLKETELEIYKLAGCEFNINSPKQLGTVLFEKMGLPKGKKTKNGYSTSAQTLEKLKGYHKIIDMILDYRAFSKLKSTYVDGFINLITEKGRIHSSFNQIETRTGRISSTEPNLQNIPVRTERGRKLRKYFKAKSGCVLVDADYSQIELRVMAHISGDKNMINAFKNGDDIHAITASQIFGIPVSMVTSEMRFRSKTVNFGILYGMGAFSLAQDLKISRYEAQNYINRYLEHYSGVDEYMKDIIEKAKEKGYAETIFNRRRYLPELNSTNHILRAFGERVARNMPIQGSAADIIKIAMINVDKKLKEKKLEAKLILQVHDELIVEAPESEAEEVKKILQTEMENAVKLKIPLEVHIAVGKTWFDAKD